MDASLPSHTATPIALIGIGCAFPGATGPREFWNLLASGRDAVSPTPQERWDADALWNSDTDAPGAVITRNGGFLSNLAAFSPEAFNITGSEAALMDPRQRLALKVAWWALEDAGIPLRSIAGVEAGVFIGASNSEFGQFEHLSDITAHAGTGLANSIIANRISYFLDLVGPSITVDTACSSALVAVHLACQSLASRECSLALAGGVNALLRPDASVCFSRAHMLAADGRCKTFDAAADGYGRGEGAGLIVLKRLSDAQADGNRIIAVIHGSAVNQDGASNGITAPNSFAQERVIKSALKRANLAPSDIQYVEAHGTGTLLGDPVEARALGRLLGGAPGRSSPLLVGSVKTNIGHLEAAAGIAGLIKLALSIEAGALPPSLHFSNRNPHIDFESANVQVVDSYRDWPEATHRYGGVSSFGFGGTNAHVVVGAAPEPQPQKTEAFDSAQLIVLSAASAESLRGLATQTAAVLENADAGDLAALAWASQTQRSALPHRLSIAGTGSTDISRSLLAFSSSIASEASHGVASRRVPMTGFMFSGQGAQQAGMARGLLATSSVFARTIADADSVLGIPLSDMLAQSAPLTQTDLAQPALLAMQIGLTRIFEAWGVTPDFVLGHSLGEYTAAVVAGVMTFEDALRLVAERGRLMQGLKERGAMVAAFGSVELIQAHLRPGAVIAAFNGPEAVAIAGACDAVAQSCKSLAAVGVMTRPLDVSVGFHSPVIEPMLAGLAKACAQVAFSPANRAMILNETGAQIQVGARLMADHWVGHARKPVLFDRCVETLSQAGCELVVEIGPTPILHRLVDRIAHAHNAKMKVVGTLKTGRDDAVSMLGALGALHVGGHKIDWSRVGGRPNGASKLPLYPFEERDFPLRLPNGATPPVLTRAQVSQQAKAPATAAISASGLSVMERLLLIVAGLLETPPDRVDPTAAFLEMGADSLLLMSAVQRIETEFGVRIPVRAFFEELSTVEALARHLGESGNRKAPAPEAADTLDAPARKIERRAFSPAPTYDERQKAHMAELIAAYTARTAGSKKYSAHARSVMADSRSSAGFRFTIKEMLYPIVGAQARGSRFWDIDANEYIDIAMGFGVHLFGHDPSFIRDALQTSLQRGLRLGPQADLAGDVARRIARVSGQDRVTFVNSGTEAVMTALRIARTVTGRSKVALFRGSYHGHFDGVLGEAPASAGTTWAEPLAPGVPPGAVSDLLVLEYGAPESLEMIRKHRNELAAVLVEPVQSRRPSLQPTEFLQHLRSLSDESGALLIFDEIITGFRLHPGGAQAHFNIRADMVTYGKIIGGGLPIGVIAGSARAMASIDGGVWQYGDDSYPSAETTFLAGTFNKHPLTMAAASAVLDEIDRQGPALQERLNEQTEALAQRMDAVFRSAQAPLHVERCGSLFRFTTNQNLDPFFYHLLNRGIYLWEGRTCFLSDAHSAEDRDAIVEAVSQSVEAIADGGFFKPATSLKTSIAPKATSFPLTPAQRQLAILAKGDPAGGSAYATAFAVNLHGVIDQSRLAEAIADAAARHDGPMNSIDAEAGLQRSDRAQRLLLTIDPTSEDALEEQLAAAIDEPFDLARPPLLRAKLLTVSSVRSVLLLVAHHAVFDGLSLQILMDEAARLYAGDVLPPPKKLMRDYVAWQNDKMATAEWAEHGDYWRGQLAGVASHNELACANPRPATRRYRGARVTQKIEPASLDQIRRGAASSGVTLSMATLAALAALLQSAGAGRDLVIGVPYAGRGMPESDRLVAYCAHFLPVRLTLPHNPTLGQLLGLARSRLLEAYDHADYPLAATLDSLSLRRDPARPLLIPFSVNIDQLAGAERFADLEVTPLSLPVRHAKLDLGLNLTVWDEGARLDLDYDSELFEASAAQNLLRAFEQLLRLVVQSPETPLAGVDLHPPIMLEGWRELEAPDFHPLPERIHAWQEKAPHAPAVEVLGAARLTRSQLGELSERIAQQIARAARGDGPVALLLSRTAVTPAGMIAAWRTGRAFVVIEPATPYARIQQMLGLANASCVLIDEDAREHAYAETLAAHYAVFDIGGLPHTPAAPLRLETQPDQIAYIVFTSGSTGAPKPVAISHRAAAAYLDGLISRLKLDHGLRYAIVSTFAADLGLTSVLPALAHGGALVIAPYETARNPDGLAAALRNTPVDFLKIVPGHLEALLAAQTPHDILPARYLVLGGEGARLSLLSTLRGLRPACRIFNHYGPSETTIGVLMGEWDRINTTESIGFDLPLAGVKILLLDNEKRRVADGQSGEIHIGGVTLAEGYLDQVAQTQERFVLSPQGAGERFYRTGDLARFRVNGSIELIGRLDDQAKIRGYRVEPSEVAIVLCAHEAISTAVALVQSDERGDSLVVYAVPKLLHVPQPEDLAQFLRARLPDYMVPARIVIVPGLPYTANGKLDRDALLLFDRAADLKPAAIEVNGGSDVETLLLAIWRQLFSRQTISRDDNFFDLGGDSITAMQMLARLHRAGLSADSALIYRYPTIAKIAGHLKLGASGCREQGRLSGPAPLLPSQYRYLEAADEMISPLNLSVLVELEPWVTAAYIERAAHVLVDHHDALRLVLTRDGAAHFCDENRLTFAQIPQGVDLEPVFTTIQASLDPAVGRLTAFAYAEGAPSQLLIAFHHLAVDGVSMQILLEDLRAVLLQMKAGEEPSLGLKSASVRQVAQALQLRAQTAGLLNQLDYWVLNTSLPPLSLPVRADAAPSDLVADEACFTVTLTAAQTDRLLRRPSADGVVAQDILIAALTMALGALTGEPMVYLQMEGHGREAVDSELDLARTVGWLTSHYPAWFDLSATPLEGAARSIHRQRADIPDGGAGYGLLRYLGSPETGAQLMSGVRPEVAFNFLGQIATPPPGAFSVLSWEPDRPCRGVERMPAAARTYKLAIEAMISNNSLIVDWKFNPSRLHFADIEKGASLFETFLAQLISPPIQNSASQAELASSQSALC